MKQDSYKVLGVMSGTSLDGLDLAVLHFKFNQGQWSFEIQQAHTQAYSREWSARLATAISDSEAIVAEMNVAYTRYLASLITAFIEAYKVDGLDAVCSHGHTVFHRPDEGFTLQIGNLPELATWIGLPVVCDFRVQDVALGGQGAPLVPIGDRMLFKEYEACLNLGGFANVSYEAVLGNRIAFDLVAVNTVLNRLVAPLGLEYDAEGKLAAGGQVIVPLLDALNALPFYGEKPPKSLGLEYVNQVIWPIIERFEAPVEDVLHTYVKHIAQQIVAGIPSGIQRVLVTGGGAFNSFLMDCLRQCATTVTFEVPTAELVNFKEALIFGFLGVLRLEETPNVLASVTGAKRDHCAGLVYAPKQINGV